MIVKCFFRGGFGDQHQGTDPKAQINREAENCRQSRPSPSAAINPLLIRLQQASRSRQVLYTVPLAASTNCYCVVVSKQSTFRNPAYETMSSFIPQQSEGIWP